MNCTFVAEFDRCLLESDETSLLELTVSSPQSKAVKTRIGIHNVAEFHSPNRETNTKVKPWNALSLLLGSQTKLVISMMKRMIETCSIFNITSETWPAISVSSKFDELCAKELAT